MGVYLSKYIVLLVLLFILACPSGNTNPARGATLVFTPSELANQMPHATQGLLLRDSQGREVLRFTSKFDFYNAWTNGVENTRLEVGFDAPSLGPSVREIDFEAMTFRWWAHCPGGAEYDYELNSSFSISEAMGGFHHGGSASYSIEKYDVPIIVFIGGSMTFTNFTVHTYFGSVLCDDEALTVGVNFTKQEEGWIVSPFSNISSVFTTNVTSVEYGLNVQLPIPLWFDFLTGALAVGTIVLILAIIRSVVIEVRKEPPEKYLSSQYDS